MPWLLCGKQDKHEGPYLLEELCICHVLIVLLWLSPVWFKCIISAGKRQTTKQAGSLPQSTAYPTAWKK